MLWEYLGRQIPLAFKAGFVGATQEPASGLVRPRVGWFVAHAKSAAGGEGGGAGQGRRVCRFDAAKPGSCRNGALCKFRHGSGGGSGDRR